MTNPIIAEMTGESLARALMDLGVWRALLTNRRNIMDRRRHAFEVANADAILEVKRTTETISMVEATVRDMALQVYAETGNKAPHAGVGIRVTIRLVYDPVAALEWATEHGMCLQLDVKKFESIARNGAAGSFVTFDLQPQATIATDLAKALEGER